VGTRMQPTLGALLLLRALSEGPATRDHLLNTLQNELGVRKNERTLRRYLATLKEAGFEISRTRGRYELRGSPVRLAFTNHEALATLNVVESLAEPDPVYGEHLASASHKVREALPKEAVRFADSGRVVFDLSFANDPPENSEILDTLRRAAHHNQKAEIYYYSLASASWSRRTVEPLRIFYAQRAHRLYAHEPGKSGLTEFRVNRIKEARNAAGQVLPPSSHQEVRSRRGTPQREGLRSLRQDRRPRRFRHHRAPPGGWRRRHGHHPERLLDR
jgi:predicted DNA-binding transcriptional regulator YafY